MTVTIYADVDTYIDVSEPSTSHGSLTTMKAGYLSADKVTYIGFDLSSITVGDISRIYMYVYATVLPVYPARFSVYPLDESFSESITFNDTQPAYTSPGGFGRFYYGYAPAWVDFASDSMSSIFVSGIHGTRLDIRIHNNTDSGVHIFNTRESSNAPYILVDVDCYVNASTGLDTNNGSSAAPWKTLDHAAANAPTGSTVHLTGDFTGEPTPNKIFPDNDEVSYEWTSQVTVENNN